MDIHNIRRIAIKIGSNVLSNDDGSINRHHIYEIVREIAKIRELLFLVNKQIRETSNKIMRETLR